jgi:RecA-family ATPase
MSEVPGEVASARRKFGQPVSNLDAGAAPGPGTPSRFKLIPFENIRIDTRPNYLVRGVIPIPGLVIVWGQPKCGKSFLAFDISMHIALGRTWRNRRTRQGTIVYCALEGGSGFANRVSAWRQRYLGEHSNPVPFYLVSESIDLIKEHDALISAIRAQVATNPALVVIDTLNRGMSGDENKSDDMAKFVRAADAVRVAFDCAVIVIHHCGVSLT